MAPKDDNTMLSTDNFILWKEIMRDKAAALWGLRGNIFHTGEEWKRDKVRRVDYMPYEEIGANGRLIDAYLPADIKRLREAMQKDDNKDIKSDFHTNCQYFAFIESKISPDSLTLIRTHPDYYETRANHSIQGLYDIILETHFTNIGGKELAADNRRSKRILYQDIKQESNESVLGYLKHFLDIITIIKAAGIPDMDSGEMAIQLLRGLNKKHNEFQTSMYKDILMGKPIPQTPYSMAMLAINFIYKTPIIIKEKEVTEEILMMRHKITKPRPSKKRNAMPYQVQSILKMSKIICHKCGNCGHKAIQCPWIINASAPPSSLILNSCSPYNVCNHPMELKNLAKLDEEKKIENRWRKNHNSNT